MVTFTVDDRDSTATVAENHPRAIAARLVSKQCAEVQPDGWMYLFQG